MRPGGAIDHAVQATTDDITCDDIVILRSAQYDPIHRGRGDTVGLGTNIVADRWLTSSDLLTYDDPDRRAVITRDIEL